MVDLELTKQLGIALGIGLLIGLQREWAEKRIAGVRTFPLISLLGFLCAQGQDVLGGWLLPTGLGGIAALLYVVNRNAVLRGIDVGLGLTTEITVLVMYLLGALVAGGRTSLAVVITGVVLVLLHLKQPMHGLVGRIGAEDFRALVRLVLIGMIILPILPDEGYGPYSVWNPYRIWMVVVLIVGISLVAYLARKMLGSGAGTLLNGLLGGLISSTAITISTSRASKEHRDYSRAAALIVMIASAVSLGRILVEIAVVAPGALASAGPPLGALAVWMTLVSVAVFLRERRHLESVGASDSPPGDLMAAVVFALLYALVLFGVAVVRDTYGERVLYLLAGVSGLTDVDAITLSVAQMMSDHELDETVGWRAILIAAAANLVFKGGLAAAMGSGRLFGRVAWMFGLSLVGAAAIFFFWP